MKKIWLTLVFLLLSYAMVTLVFRLNNNKIRIEAAEKLLWITDELGTKENIPLPASIEILPQYLLEIKYVYKDSRALTKLIIIKLTGRRLRGFYWLIEKAVYISDENDKDLILVHELTHHALAILFPKGWPDNDEELANEIEARYKKSQRR